VEIILGSLCFLLLFFGWEEVEPAISTVYPADIRGLTTTLLVSLRAPASVYNRGSSPLSVAEGYAQPGPDLFPDANVDGLSDHGLRQPV
jgi:hypothetical protein